MARMRITGKTFGARLLPDLKPSEVQATFANERRSFQTKHPLMRLHPAKVTNAHGIQTAVHYLTAPDDWLTITIESGAGL